MNSDAKQNATQEPTQEQPFVTSVEQSTKANIWSYPMKLYPAIGKSPLNDIESVKSAIMNGLDPNTLWAEEELVLTVRKSGCFIWSRPPPWDAWPHWNTPLHRAIKFSDFETAEFLLHHGANINIYNAIGKTPLHEAIWNRKYDAIRFLLDHKAEMNNFTLGACVRYEDAKKDMYGIAGQLNIQHAISFSDLTSVQLLVQAGADLCPPSQHPWTTIDLALLYGDRRIVELLLKQGYKLPAGGSTSSRDVCQDSSRGLLKFSRDNNIVPSRDLYGVYCFVLGNIDQAAIVDADILIKRFFETLYETANDTDGKKRMATCTSCQDFQCEARVIFETDDYFAFDIGQNRQHLSFTFNLHPSRSQLIDSASNGCAICAVIADALDDHEKNPRRALEPFYREFGSKFDSVKIQARFWSLDRINVSCGELHTEIRIFQVYDSLTRSFEDSHLMDTSTGSSSAMVMAKNWIQICQENHTECQEVQRKRQRKDILPRRLLHIAPSEIQPRVVHVQDTVPYCALSYCWGVKDFFTTTRDNFVQNMRGIRMEFFPAIMRDAIYVVRSLEYEYIWIDALCIVQDDERDWAHEASIMGDIYSNAELTISSRTLWTEQPFELWKKQVIEFTRRSLTRASDRPPAFDAISKSLATAVRCNPLCGIWNGDKLFESLCWQTENCVDASLKLPNVPSWTWLACTGEISFDWASRGGREDVQTSSGATVVSINSEATGLSITLRGTLHRKQRIDVSLLEHWERLYGKRSHKSSVYLDYNMGDDRDVYTFDTLHFPEGPPHKGLGLNRWSNGRVAETLRLLLQRVDNKLNTFRRIGIGKIPHRHSKRGPEPDPHEGIIPVSCISHEITQNKWLKTDEETLSDQQFTLV